jgi:hypothetical protein
MICGRVRGGDGAWSTVSCMAPSFRFGGGMGPRPRRALSRLGGAAVVTGYVEADGRAACRPAGLLPRQRNQNHNAERLPPGRMPPIDVMGDRRAMPPAISCKPFPNLRAGGEVALCVIFCDVRASHGLLAFLGAVRVWVVR